MIRRRVVVHGQVQGVFFRASCVQEARRVGAAGWVANRPDGTVEAVVEGDEATVEHMLAWCQEGPTRARVSQVDVAEEPAEGLSGFEQR
ncbi:acylphosphatase [Aeromicrobium halocynthiae]|uniref:Acylphosphatase n=1 Tax=Aeromicrobium halocynthiae TaxID=560557 RepID=A0ABN2VZJ6_9ACTN